VRFFTILFTRERKMKRCIVLFSGGLDSSTCLALALHEGYEVFPLTIDYAQRHSVEIEKSRLLLDYFKKETKWKGRLAQAILFKIDLRKIGGSVLTDDRMEVNDYFEKRDGIPLTYVPARNTIFLSLALAYGEVLEADHIFIGVNAVDYSGYPDCRPEYIKAFAKMASLATKRGVEGKPVQIHTPLINLKKSEIIKLGTRLGVPYELTWSCYRGVEPACGRCHSCILRLRGFREAGLRDPLEYRVVPEEI